MTTDAPKPEWREVYASRQLGGFNETSNHEATDYNHVEIDPYETGRQLRSNYRLLISAVVPRPVGFLSTLSRNGLSTNCSPFSYFQMFNHDPPLFIFGFASSLASPRDSLRNLVETGEGVINIVSEHMLEAVNAASINAPYGTSEFSLAGLEPAPCSVVKAPRVKDAIFSIECNLIETKEYASKIDPDKVTCTTAIVEGVRFWAREDAINSKSDHLDLEKLKPISRLGGTTYGRLGHICDMPRPQWQTSDPVGITNTGPS
ncbi:hypothetical protein BJY01DRAFT_243128 [Aspergillus pseudoustus]|uniref:Flavin reductase like domain-containing protein n=1 Tax=Aspergillus pseudoustus TaxID=1810923 RepID=A0ABR4KV62_9EURO